MHALEIDDVARTCLMNCVRTRDAQYQWAPMSLNRVDTVGLKFSHCCSSLFLPVIAGLFVVKQ